MVGCWGGYGHQAPAGARQRQGSMPSIIPRCVLYNIFNSRVFIAISPEQCSRILRVSAYPGWETPMWKIVIQSDFRACVSCRFPVLIPNENEISLSNIPRHEGFLCLLSDTFTRYPDLSSQPPYAYSQHHVVQNVAIWFWSRFWRYEISMGWLRGNSARYP